MRYIDQWLSGLGLDHIIPLLQEHGITTPNKLAQLSLRDMYEVVGVNDAEDRKKLYFLIQRLQSILKKSPPQEEGEVNEGDTPPPSHSTNKEPPQHSHSDRHPEIIPRQGSNVSVSPLRPRPTDHESTHFPTRHNSHSSSGRNLINPPPAAADEENFDEQEEEEEDEEEEDEEEEEEDEDEGEESSDLRVLRRQHQSQGGSPQRAGHPPLLSIAVPPTTRPLQQPREAEPVQTHRNGRLSAPAISQNQKAIVSHSLRVPSPIHVEEAIHQPSRGVGTGVAGGAGAHNPPPTRNVLNRPGNQQQQHHHHHHHHRENSQENLSDPAELDDEEVVPPPPTKPGFIPTKSTPQMTIRKPVKLSSTPSRHSIAAPQPYQQSPKLRNYRGRSQSPPPSPPPTPPPEESGHHRRSQSDQPYHQPPHQAYNPSHYEKNDGRNDNFASHQQSSPRRNTVNVQNQRAQVVTSSSTRITQIQSSSQYVETFQQQQPQQQHHHHHHHQQHHNSHAPQQQSSSQVEQHEIDVPDMAIRVIVKKRPLNRLDGKGDKDVLEIRDGGHVIVHEPKTKVDLTKVVETTEFFFDDAFTDLDTNELIYSRAIRPLVKTALEGGKGSCFAYGQTGSGKTFTMMGSNPSAPSQVKINAGLYVLAARDIFRLLDIKTRQARATGEPQQNFQVMVSCFEIYSGKLFDLLNDRGIIRCLEDSKQQVQLPGLTEHKVNNVDELLIMMSKAHEQRSTGSTGANLESSRSHQVLQLSVQISTLGKNKKLTAFKKYGQLSFIDLAGSERGADTTNNSKQTRMEGAEINTSLLALKEVIRSLEKKHGHTPFRGSKLTQVLKDSFIGDKTRTCMVACVSPNMCNCEHTLNTLRYADRVKEHQSQSQPQSQLQPQPPLHIRGKSEVMDGYADQSIGDYRGGNQRPATAQQYQTRDDLDLDNNLYHARPNTAFPAPKESNRRASLDRGYNTPSNSINYPQPQPLTRALSIGTTSSRKSQKDNSRGPYLDDFNGKNSRPSEQLRQGQGPSQGQGHGQGYNQGSSQQQGPSQGGLSTPVQYQVKKIDSAPPPSQRSSMSTANSSGIRLLRGGNNSVAPTSFSSRDADYDPDPYQSVGKLPPPPPPPEATNYDNELNDDYGEEEEGEGEDSQFENDYSDPYDEEFEENDENELPNDVDDSDEPVIFDYDKSSSLGETLMLQKTVNLVSAHKLAIAEMVEVMKEEMELVQTMEQASQRDSHLYIEQMDQILAAKLESINALRMELKSFQKYRMEVRADSSYSTGR